MELLTFGFAILVALAVIAGAVTVTETVAMTLSAREILDTADAPFADSNSFVTHSGLNLASVSYTANSAAGLNVKLVAQGEIAMVAGAATLDLTAAPGTTGPVDLTGHKIRHMLIRSKAGNANPIKIKFGAANPYTGFGADFALTLPAAGKRAMLEGSTAVAVSGANCELDISGTGTQTLEFILTAGDN